MTTKISKPMTDLKHKISKLVNCFRMRPRIKTTKERYRKPENFTSFKELILMKQCIENPNNRIITTYTSIKIHNIDECFVNRRLQEVETEWKRLSVNSLCYVGRIEETSQDTQGGGEIRRKCSLSFSPITRWI